MRPAFRRYNGRMAKEFGVTAKKAEELAARMAAVEEELAGLMDQWENLSGQIESLEEALNAIS